MIVLLASCGACAGSAGTIDESSPRILVVDVAGRPVPGLTVGFADPRARGWSTVEDPLGVSNGRGTVALSRPQPSGLLRAKGAGWTTLMEVWIPEHVPLPEEISLVVAEARDLTGRVTTALGEPLAGATVEWRVYGSQGAGPVRSARHALPCSDSTLTGPDGGFRLEAVPRAALSHLVVSAQGFEPYAVPTTGLGAMAELSLRPLSSERFLHVAVKDGSGLPVAGASVHLGIWTARTDPSGRCEIEVPQAVSPGLGLAVLSAGSRPVVIEGFGRKWRGFSASAPLEIRLESEEQEIRGQVLDHDGQPGRSWRVGIVEGTDICPGAWLPRYVEELGPEAGVPWDDLPGVETDAEGRFVLRGVLDREYALRAWDPATAAELRVEGIAPGRDVEMRLPAGVTVPSVSGQVRSLRGEPLSDVTVSVTLLLRGEPGNVIGSLAVTGAQATTDRDGSFELRNVPRQGIWLTIRGERAAPTRRWVGSAELEDTLSITVPELRTLVLSRSGDEGRWVRAVDSTKAELPFVTFGWNEWRSAQELYLQPGLPITVDVSEAAVELHVFSSSRALVAEIPLRPRADDGAGELGVDVP